MHYNERNPHPFSTRKTELIWDGKYDERGNRRTLNITTATLPLQLIEAIPHRARFANEPTGQRTNPVGAVFNRAIPHARFAHASTGAKPLNSMRPVNSFQI